MTHCSGQGSQYGRERPQMLEVSTAGYLVDQVQPASRRDVLVEAKWLNHSRLRNSLPEKLLVDYLVSD